MRDLLSFMKIDRVPTARLSAPAALSRVKADEITGWIRGLQATDAPGLGYSGLVDGMVFPAVVGLRQMAGGIVGSVASPGSDTFVNIVKAGPAAVPFLVRELSNRTPTKLTIRESRWNRLRYVIEDVSWNPFNRRERAALRKLNVETLTSDVSEGDAYSITVGDLCFVALGEIVGRSYSAVRYQATALSFVHGLSHFPQLCDAMGMVWRGDRADQLLLDSLLIDFSTRAVDDSHADFRSDQYSWGNDFQVSAATRLLYYFPQIAVPLIVKRLDGLDVRGVPSFSGPGAQSRNDTHRYIEREVRNGVNAADFIRAVSWTKDRRVADALGRVRARSNDNEIRKALRV